MPDNITMSLEAVRALLQEEFRSLEAKLDAKLPSAINSALDAKLPSAINSALEHATGTIKFNVEH